MKLTPEQERKIREIVDRHVILDFDDFPKSCSPYAITRDVIEFINSLLTDNAVINTSVCKNGHLAYDPCPTCAQNARDLHLSCD